MNVARRRVRSLYKQQLFAIFGVMAGAFIILSYSVLTITQAYLYQQSRYDAQRNALFLGAYTSAYRQNRALTQEDYQTYVKNMALVSDSFIFVNDLVEGNSYATDGENFFPIKRNDVSHSVVDSVMSLNEYEAYTDLGGIFTEERYIYGVTYTINHNGEAMPVGFVIVSPNLERINDLWQGFSSIFLGITIIVISLTLFLLSYLSARLVLPLNQLTDTARRFGKGELTARLEGYEERNDEVGALTKEFNAMAVSIAKAEEQRSAFISNVSHELKTPMTTIGGFAEALLDGTVPPEKREKSLEIIARETRRLSRLVQQMLEISRMEVEADAPLVQEEFDLIELLAQVIIGLEGKICSRNLEVDVCLPEGELLVWGNQDGITQVCYNLLDNAIKFSTEHTVIQVRLEVIGRKVHVSVENHGEVLDESTLPMLFQQFHKGDYSRHSHPEGLGLGLYIVKNILVKLQESITVTSKDAVTCFTFTLSLV